MSGHIGRLAAIFVAVIALGGCGTLLQGGTVDGGLFGGVFSGKGSGSSSSDRGLAAMAKGDYQSAEIHFQRALKASPKNVYALLGQGLVYQNTGQAVRAREMYEAILAIRPGADQKFVVWNSMTTRPLTEIASVNLALLESGGVLTSMGRGAAGSSSGAYYQPGSLPPAGGGVSGAAVGSATLGRGGVGLSQPVMLGMGASPMAGMSLSGGDANVVSRFKTLLALREQGLITNEEFAARRQANIGALVPLSAPPPAAGLDRPVPSTEQISGRLRAIARALEMRAISVGQHSAERTMILDALMPAAPVVVANPGAPPKGLMEAADAVRRLEFLKAGALISSDEYSKERAAIEGKFHDLGAVPSRKAAAPAMASGMASAKGPQPAVHIASYRSKQAAARGWSEAKQRHLALLGKLRSDVKRINLGPSKGTFYRLLAGPLKSSEASKSLCQRLKLRGQYCQPSFMQVK